MSLLHLWRTFVLLNFSKLRLHCSHEVLVVVCLACHLLLQYVQVLTFSIVRINFQFLLLVIAAVVPGIGNAGMILWLVALFFCSFGIRAIVM